MPIRINLLAEAQAAEDVRRRDPVKRSLYVAGALVVMVLVWISSLQVKIMADKNRLSNLETRLGTHTNDYDQILIHKRILGDVNDKLAALNKLAANRFLEAALLDSLMHATTEGIQLTKFHTEQTFEVIAEVAPVRDEGKLVSVGHPASATEKIKLQLDARDTSANPGSEQITKFKNALAHSAYFEFQHISTNNILLKNLGAPQLDNDSGKAYVLFSLECLYPDRVR